MRRLHQFDVMRANKAPFSFGLEPRVPFLDKAFLDTSMTFDPADKMVRTLPLMLLTWPCHQVLTETLYGEHDLF